MKYYNISLDSHGLEPTVYTLLIVDTFGSASVICIPLKYIACHILSINISICMNFSIVHTCAQIHLRCIL